jgi:hypothetical protein
MGNSLPPTVFATIEPPKFINGRAIAIKAAIINAAII